MFKIEIKRLLCTAIFFSFQLMLFGNNQTPDVSPIYPGKKLPFSISIELADFQLPTGMHSGVVAVHEGKWLFLAGRTNGMHSFEEDPNNFPPDAQNTTVFVVDPKEKTTYSRSLNAIGAGLTSTQVDLLSVTSPQYYQDGDTLYITGGYGIDSTTGLFTTKDVLTAIYVPGLMDWVVRPDVETTAYRYIRQISDPIFQVTGGYMTKMEDHSTLLVFGQDFEGFYVPQSDGTYTEVVRRFKIIDNGSNLSIEAKESKPANPDPNYRRRDLNVIPGIRHHDGKYVPYLTAFSGVFTLTEGIWTVPVTITPTGHPFMADPNDSQTFKQGMNNYVSASTSLFSKEKNATYSILLGGISYGYFNGDTFETSGAFPFINQVTTIKYNHSGHFKQYIMDAEYPVILSTQSNPGNPLLFGTGAYFMLPKKLKPYDNGVIKYDDLNHSSLIGYIVGGIQSTVQNTSTITDSSASPYIFKVRLKKNM